MKSQKWEEFASWHIKTEMKKRNLTIAKLTELFKAHGFEVSKDSVRGKIARGKFSFIFYLQFMQIINTSTMEVFFDKNPADHTIRLS